MTSPKLRYRGLDLLRGVAALSILELHLEHAMGHFLFNRAYLAVDLFFMLSGFVIAYSYEARLLSGYRFRDFMRQRAIRLYPMAILGTLLGAAVAAYQLDVFHDAAVRWPWLASTCLGSLLLPSPYLHDYALDSPFPLDVPLWSLFWEMVASVVYGLWARRASTRALIAIVALCTVVLFARCLTGGNLDGAWSGVMLQLGPFKIAYAFSLGVLLYRAHQATGGLPFRVPPALLALVFLGAATIPELPDHDGMVDFFAVVVVFPPMVFLAAEASDPAVETGFVDWLGRLSYPVYALQYPFRTLIHPWAVSRTGPATLVGDYAHILAGDLAIIALATLVLVYVDEPVRRWLVQRSRREPRVAAAA